MGSEPVSGTGMSGLVKTVLVIQSISLSMLGFWLVKEYQNNIFLQQYVHNAFWTYLPAIAFIATFSVAVGASEAYSRVGAKNNDTTMAGRTGPHGLLLTGGFEPAQPVDLKTTQPQTPAEQSSPDQALEPVLSFAPVFEESRPPQILKRVEKDETADQYVPPPYPVIRRLRPPRDPDAQETSKSIPTPRPLNRVGLPAQFTIPPPPVVRQIGKPTRTNSLRNEPRTRPSSRSDELDDDYMTFGRPEPIAEAAQEETDTDRSSETPSRTPSRTRPVKRKRTVDENMSNDLA